MDTSSASSFDCDRHSNDSDEDVDQSVDLISDKFIQQLDLQCNDNDDDEDDDFTFMIIGKDEEAPNIYDDKVSEEGKMRAVFPLFDQHLLEDEEAEYDIEEIETLSILPPVDKIFIESPRGFPTNSTATQHDAAAGPFCEWSKESAAAELSKKSNSTGFSKLWRLKEKVGRSNSEGRDAFVFLKSADKSTTTATTSSSSKKPVNGTFVKVQGVVGGQARVVKAKKASAHEAYMRRSKGHTEEERRRSYLPYRPELMGIFTNAHVGFSKNLHPY